MIVQLLTEHHLEFLSLKGGCRGLSESTLVKMLHCWKSHAASQLYKKTNPGAILKRVFYKLSLDHPHQHPLEQQEPRNGISLLAFC